LLSNPSFKKSGPVYRFGIGRKKLKL